MVKNIDYGKYFVPPMILFGLLICSSCAKPITSAQLIPDNTGKEFKINRGPLYRSIFVENVDGGKETHPLLEPNVGNPAMKEAIVKSLQGNNYLAATSDGSTYGLTVFLVENDCPPGGFTKTVTTFVRYKLIGKQSGDILYDEVIDASDTKGWHDSPNGENIYGLALEKSMKKNIEKFIKQLSLLNRK